MSAERSRPLDHLAIALGIIALFILVLGALRARAWVEMVTATQLRDPDPLKLIFRISATGHLAGAVALALLCLRCITGAVDRLNRGLWIAAVILNALVGLEIIAGLLTELAGRQDPLLWRLYRKTWFMLLSTAINKGAIAVMLVVALRVARHRWALLAGVSGLLVLFVSVFGNYLIPNDSSYTKVAWLQYGFGAVPNALALGAAAALCWMAAASRRAASGLLDPIGGSAWAGAADGLRLYGTALVWRLVITLGGYLLLLLAVLGQSADLAKMLFWTLPLVSLITGALMFAGIVKYSRQPANSPGRSAAVFAAAAMGMAMLVELYLLYLVFKTSGDAEGYSSARAAREAMESAQRLGPWTLALGFAALGSLLFSFAAVARRLADHGLGRRVYGVGAWLVAIAIAAVGFKLWLGGGKALGRDELGTIVVFALLVAIAALVVLIGYINLVREVESRLRIASAGAEVPTAVVIEP